MNSNDIKDFLENKRKEGKSEKTIASYKNDLEQFIKYLELKGIERVESSNWDIVTDKYKRHLIKNNIKPSSINRKIVSLNQYFKFRGMDYKIKPMRIQRQLILNEVINKNEIDRMLKCCDNSRDRAIIITLHKTGLRVSELLEIEVSDTNKRKLEIKGKGGKYRSVLISTDVRMSWQSYLKDRQQCDSDKLFVGKRGHLRRQSINKIIHKYSKRARVKKAKAHPHSFRHGFCKSLANDGVSIEVIADLAGHESIETTRIYTRHSESELLSILDRI